MKSTLIKLLCLILITPNAYGEIRIIANEGDSLHSLAKKHGIELRELMNANNITNANISILGKSIIIPVGTKEVQKRGSILYEVLAGDTINKIARKFQVNKSEIISENRIDDPSSIKIGQIIILPYGAKKISEEKKPYIKSKSIKKVNYHIVSQGDSISRISSIHNIPVENLTRMNEIIDPKKMTIGKKLLLRSNIENDIKSWRNYGPLNVDWSNWQYLDGHYITTVFNENKTVFFLAVNCSHRMLTNTNRQEEWESWVFPSTKFEHFLINDFCTKTYLKQD